MLYNKAEYVLKGLIQRNYNLLIQREKKLARRKMASKSRNQNRRKS
jgi:hypothetical protein